MLLELVRLVGPAERERLFVFLEEQTGQDFGSDLDADEMLALSLWPASG